MLDSIPFLRIFKTGFTNFIRHIWLSATATVVMVVTLVILATLLILFGITNYSVKSIQEKVDVSVYFKNGLAEAKVKSIIDDLNKDPKIKQPIVYTTAEQALEKFKQKNQNNPVVLQSLEELATNPLPATLNVQAYKIEDYPEIAERLKSSQYKDFISYVNFEDNRVVIQRLQKILDITVTFGLGLAIVFAIIAILVLFNTITLTIYNRREEVEIMRLVGATDWYIRGPFLAEGLLYSIISTGVTTLLLVPIFSKVLPRISAFVNPEVNIFNQNIFHFWYLIAILFAVSVIFTTFSTMLAIRKYLKI
jgi:cell division transport system permease protein